MDKETKRIWDFTRNYIKENVDNPFREILEKDPVNNLRISSFLVTITKVKDLVFSNPDSINKNYIHKRMVRVGKKKFIEELRKYIEEENNNPEIEELIDNSQMKTYAVTYLNRELNWIVISILSASYVSANILQRSIFEFLINWLTNEHGSMGDKIDSIFFADNEDKKYLKKTWKKLNKWAHPFGHWEKNICPNYANHNPIYHEELFNESLDYFITIMDLYISTVITNYDIDCSFLNDGLFYNKNLYRLKIVDKVTVNSI